MMKFAEKVTRSPNIQTYKIRRITCVYQIKLANYIIDATIIPFIPQTLDQSVSLHQRVIWLSDYVFVLLTYRTSSDLMVIRDSRRSSSDRGDTMRDKTASRDKSAARISRKREAERMRLVHTGRYALVSTVKLQSHRVVCSCQSGANLAALPPALRYYGFMPPPLQHLVTACASYSPCAFASQYPRSSFGSLYHLHAAVLSPADIPCHICVRFIENYGGLFRSRISHARSLERNVSRGEKNI